MIIGRNGKHIFQNRMQLILCLQFHDLLCNVAANLRFLTPIELQTADIQNKIKTKETKFSKMFNFFSLKL